MDHVKESVECFSTVSNWIYGKERNPEDNLRMRETAHASLYHWLNRDDCKPVNLSIGLWQVSRVHAILGEGATAMLYAGECIDLSETNSLSPFSIGYGYEAAARAARVSGGLESYAAYLGKAEEQLGKVDDAEDRKYLEEDLSELKTAE